jgi:hypothetical protein
VRDCLKEARSSRGPDEQKPDTRQRWSDERAGCRKVHIHQELAPAEAGARAVNPAGVRGRLSGLLREICTVSFGTEEARKAA